MSVLERDVCIKDVCIRERDVCIREIFLYSLEMSALERGMSVLER